MNRWTSLPSAKLPVTQSVTRGVAAEFWVLSNDIFGVLVTRCFPTLSVFILLYRRYKAIKLVYCGDDVEKR